MTRLLYAAWGFPGGVFDSGNLAFQPVSISAISKSETPNFATKAPRSQRNFQL
jgi:hypothetical protein